MLSPPHWLSGRSLEEIAFHLHEYSERHTEFIDLFEEEEMALYHSNKYSQVLRTSWTTGAFWYFQALDSPSTSLALFTDHIQPRFAKLSSSSREEFNRVVAPFWDFGATRFISTKVKKQEEYSLQIRQIFSAVTTTGL
jgi:hypothetical protein